LAFFEFAASSSSSNEPAEAKAQVFMRPTVIISVPALSGLVLTPILPIFDPKDGGAVYAKGEDNSGG
jgi:hypothetical protein